MKKHYFNTTEIIIWITSTVLIIASFFIFNSKSTLTLIASLIGCTAIIFNAKGNPIGQALMVIFSLIYGIISYSCRYYGEMITYLGMTAPMAVFALISWIKHPYQNGKLQVAVGSPIKNIYRLVIVTVVITAIFGCILYCFDTSNLFFSTLSVTTSFVAVYLTYKRSPYFSIAYAANDVVLIILWALVTKDDISYASVIICFIAFLISDIYAFIAWQRMKTTQLKSK